MKKRIIAKHKVNYVPVAAAKKLIKKSQGSSLSLYCCFTTRAMFSHFFELVYFPGLPRNCELEGKVVVGLGDIP